MLLLVQVIDGMRSTSRTESNNCERSSKGRSSRSRPQSMDSSAYEKLLSGIGSVCSLLALCKGHDGLSLLPANVDWQCQRMRVNWQSSTTISRSWRWCSRVAGVYSNYSIREMKWIEIVGCHFDIILLAYIISLQWWAMWHWCRHTTHIVSRYCLSADMCPRYRHLWLVVVKCSLP